MIDGKLEEVEIPAAEAATMRERARWIGGLWFGLAAGVVAFATYTWVDHEPVGFALAMSIFIGLFFGAVGSAIFRDHVQKRLLERVARQIRGQP